MTNVVGLPSELSELGTKYVRDEFRRHLKCTPMEAQLFMTEWAVGKLLFVSGIKCTFNYIFVRLFICGYVFLFCSCFYLIRNMRQHLANNWG